MTGVNLRLPKAWVVKCVRPAKLLRGLSCKEVNLIRPCVPSHVAYEIGREGNEPSKALGQCTHDRKVGAGTARKRCICQHKVERG